jgi:SNF2 family DNA or RNA helicase
VKVYELTDDHRYRLHALAVPGATWDGEHYVVVDPTPRAAAAALALFKGLANRYPDLMVLRDEAYGEARPTDYASGAGLTLDPVLNGIELHDFQNVDGGYLEAIMRRDGAANVLWEMGLGKTVVAAGFIQKLDCQRTLVVCRNDAKVPVWQAELEAVLPAYTIGVLPNEKKKREFALKSLMDPLKLGASQWLVFVVHYEALALIAGDRGKGKGWDRLGQWDMMIFDEGHRLASMNPNSHKNTQMGKGTMKARRHATHAVNLTGSSIMNHPQDLFGQLHYLQPDRYKAKWRDFNDRFLDYVDVQGAKVCIGWQPAALPQLRDELGVFSVYRKRDEVLDLPPLTKREILLDLEPKQRKAYDDMRDQFWAELGDDTVIATSAITQLNHLRQMATWVDGLPSAKLDFAINEIEEEPDEQFVVFTWYKAPGRALAERLSEDAVVVDGDVPPAGRADALERHRKGDVRVLVGSIATLGESLNLQYCAQAIRLDRHWNPGVNAQTDGRLHRNGQKNPVYLRDLIARDTVDELKVMPSIKNKESYRRAVFGE